jgi:hypothetical protein
MKKYIIISFLAALVFLVGCEEKINTVLDIRSNPSISAPAAGSTFLLEEANAGEVMTTIEWSGADYGFPAGVTYTIELGLEDGMFANPRPFKVITASGTSLDVIVGEFNNSLLSAGVAPNAEKDVYLRVMATVNPDVEPIYSDPIMIKVTPYLVVIDYPQLQVPGSYQGWDPANDSTVIYSLLGDGNFEGYAYFASDGDKFKFTDGPSWDTNWGDDGLDGTLDPNGADIPCGVAGVYKLNVDLNALTHTFVKTDWGVVGDATPGGWDNDTDMVFDETSGTLKVTLDLVVGKIKFRANDAWDINLGDDNANRSLEYGGADIDISEAGNYTVELVLNKANYTYNITKN